MGVHNLWELLAPVGRRVSVETLAGKKLAIDASIWMIQFMKAMRDEKGEMIRNAHLVGFFRRICKLLFLRVKPVFVFDGGTPALKRRTVIARRKQRENAQTKIRKTAEKLLLNQLKAIRLKELQKNLQEQRQDDLEPEVVGTKSREKAKGKRVVDETIMASHLSEDNNISTAACSREELDAMLAASIAAEEEGSFAPHASTSDAGLRYEEDEDEGDDEEEMILPAMHGNVDPAVLAALPPSMQLDLLVQMRERLMAENRQRYQKVKKVPSRFSELQIQAYLKTVAFRREIDAVQKSAAGKGFGGMPTSRIASEANREFIFSSSFTGDKQVLTSGGEVRNDTEATENSRVNVSSKAVNDIVSVTRSNQTEECSRDTAQTELPNDVETYLDERGRIRLSRGRAMGIRMTRDLQRNLDLMKESQKESVPSDEDVDNDPSNSSTLIPPNPSGSNSSHNPKESNEEICHTNQSFEDSTLRNVAPLEISFETNDDHKSGDDEDLFARLVAGETLMNVPSDSSPAQKQSDHEDISISDCEWEEGVIDGNIAIANKQSIHELKPYLADDDMDDDSMVEWEDGCASISKDVSPHPVECPGNLSRGALVEEAEYQEAIRRSLVDLKGCGDSNASCENLKSVNAGLIDNLCESPSISKESSIPESSISAKENVELHKSSSETQTNKMNDKPNQNQTKRSLTLLSGIGNKMIDNQGVLNMSQDCNNIDTQSIPYVEAKVVDLDSSTKIAPGRCSNFVQIKTNDLRLPEEINESLENRPEKVILIQEQQGDMKSSKIGSSMRTDGSSGVPNSSSYALPVNLPTLNQVDLSHRELEAKVDDHLNESLISESASFIAEENKSDFELQLSPGHDVLHFQKEKSGGNSSFMDSMAGQVPITEASLEEELLILDEESRELGNEHRRLERNAESVSGEMFAECQELLQMFGLPYIIAPMEAEAQCAFMELANLVDGVVTDDSDAFLFGARSVYKNIFDDRKYVETYFMKDIESELGLDRDKLIRMALLLGSDYTEGVSGIGIVNAIEVVNAFPENDGLRQFREWIESPDPSILGKLDVQEGPGSRKRRSKVQENEKNNPSENSDCDLNMSQSADENKKLKQIFMEKHRNVSKNWHIPSTFPSDVVIAAYASPQVDNSTDSFSWGKPDLLTLHKVCWEKFGWGSKKADEVLLPVLKEYEKHETQLRLEAFYTFNEKFAKIRSKRIQSALKGVRGNNLEDVKNDSGGGDSKSKKKRKTNYVKRKTTEVQKDSDVPEIGGIKEKISKISKPKKSKRRNSQEETVDEVDTRPSEEASMKSSARNGSSDRRDMSKRILTSGKRKKNKADSSLEDARTSSDGDFNEETEERSPVECERPLKVRKSKRHRKAVNYTISDDDIVEECSTTASKLDGLVDETSHNQVIGNSSSGKTPNEENKPENHQQESREDFLQSVGGFCGEATEPSQAYFGDINDAVVEDPLLEEYLKMGGGFCLEDDAAHGNTDGYPDKAADSSQVNSRSDGDLNAEDHISKEYLESGGGFCLDDDETADQNRDNRTSVTMHNCAANAEEETSQSHPSQSTSSHVSPEDDLCKGKSDASDTKNVSNRKGSISYSGFSSPDHTSDKEKDGGSENRTPLRAMPNLRRKRRQT